MDGDTARVDGGNIEHVGNHVGHGKRVRLEALRELRNPRRKGRIIRCVADELSHHIDRGERYADVVRNRGEQAALARARRFGLPATRIQCVHGNRQPVQQRGGDQQSNAGEDAVHKERLVRFENAGRYL